MSLSKAIEYCKGKSAGKRDFINIQIAAWLQELKIRRTIGAAAICDAEFPLLKENEIERDAFIMKYVERDSAGGLI